MKAQFCTCCLLLFVFFSVKPAYCSELRDNDKRDIQGISPGQTLEEASSHLKNCDLSAQFSIWANIHDAIDNNGLVQISCNVSQTSIFFFKVNKYATPKVIQSAKLSFCSYDGDISVSENVIKTYGIHSSPVKLDIHGKTLIRYMLDDNTSLTFGLQFQHRLPSKCELHFRH